MKILKTFSVFALSAIVLASCGGKKETNQVEEVVIIPGEYHNEDMGFSLKYDTATLNLVKEDTASVLFAGLDNATLRVFKDVRTDKNGEVLSMKQYFEQDEVVKPGHKFGHASLRSDHYSLSGAVGDSIYYQKSIYKRGGILTAKLTYSAYVRDKYDEKLDKLFNSFK